MTRRIRIKGYKLARDGRRLVPCYKHLPVNLRLQKQASQRVRSGKSAKSGVSQLP
jgi:hypothetical protein